MTEDEAVDFVRQRKVAYQIAFDSAAGREVLKDLNRFCMADRTCFHADPRIHAALEGRREVILRIEAHRNLSPEDLAIYCGIAVVPNKGDHDNE